MTCPPSHDNQQARTRSRRVILILIGIWVLSVSDLVLTLLAHAAGGFYEANPLARTMLHDAKLLSLFKLGSLALATAIFLYYRCRRIASQAAWAMFIVYFLLGLVWFRYFRALEAHKSLNRPVPARTPQRTENQPETTGSRTTGATVSGHRRGVGTAAGSTAEPPSLISVPLPGDNAISPIGADQPAR